MLMMSRKTFQTYGIAQVVQILHQDWSKHETKTSPTNIHIYIKGKHIHFTRI